MSRVRLRRERVWEPFFRRRLSDAEAAPRAPVREGVGLDTRKTAPAGRPDGAAHA